LRRLQTSHANVTCTLFSFFAISLSRARALGAPGAVAAAGLEPATTRL